jgi:type III restriction enzyme
MKLHFDPDQPFQRAAIDAVVDLFGGQPQGMPTFTPINVGDYGELFAGQVQTELGMGNQILLDEEKLRNNTRIVQHRNDIEIG